MLLRVRGHLFVDFGPPLNECALLQDLTTVDIDNDSDRRRYPRKRISVPVNVSTRERRDRVGMTRDMSVTGLQFHSLSRFVVGEQIVVTFALGEGPQLGVAQGQVVRTTVDDSPESMFRYCTAIQFEAPLLDLEPLIA